MPLHGPPSLRFQPNPIAGMLADLEAGWDVPNPVSVEPGRVHSEPTPLQATTLQLLDVKLAT